MPEPMGFLCPWALSREDAASRIATNYLRFIAVYTAARAESA